MKKVQIIFFSIYGLFHLGIVFMAFYVHNLFSTSNLVELFSMKDYVPTMRWIGLGGLIIFALNILMFMIMKKNFESKYKVLENEKNKYKAEMFDMQEAAKASSSVSDSIEPGSDTTSEH